MVREQNAVHTQIGEFLRIFEVLHALNHDLAGPHFTDNLQVFIVDGGVHRVIQKLAHGAAGRGERGEFQLGRGQEVEPPPGARNRVQQGLHRQMRRNRETIALIAQARASNGCIHGEEERIESCLGGALYQSVGDFALAHDIQLEPEAAIGVCSAHILNAGSAQSRQGEGDARGTCCTGASDLTFGLHQAGEAGGSDTERHGGSTT